MNRATGTYRVTKWEDEEVKAFIPAPLPPANPPLKIDEEITRLLSNAETAIGKLSVAADMVPSADWFLYGFVRKEALITSQIEGTQATLRDVLTFEAEEQPQRPEDVREVCNYIEALTYARKELSRAKGLPLSIRLLCQAHKRLMKGTRGRNKQPGQLRRSQNWIGGSRPGNARFVPPPPDVLSESLTSLERWIHSKDPLHPLIKIGLAHVQFETIHPFLDGNGRIGRLLITLLIEHWKLLNAPLLYISVSFKRHRQDYYDHLNRVRIKGDWESWIKFFLECIRESADDAVSSAQKLFAITTTGRKKVATHDGATLASIRLFDILPAHPIMTLPLAGNLLGISKPTASKTIDALRDAAILQEITGKRRDRIYAYHEYLQVLMPDTD